MNPARRFIADIMSRRISDYLAVAVAISIPWSTSATSILMSLWLLAFLPTLDLVALRRAIASPAGGIPLLLCAWAALGMLWGDTTWTERFEGLRQFHKLLFIPVLLAYFHESSRGALVMASFFASCIALLALSSITALWPDLQWWQSRGLGVPVKNYIAQSVEFTISAFCLLYLSADAWTARARAFAIVNVAIALAFIASMLFVATSRTELIVIVVLIVLFGVNRAGVKGAALGVFAAAAVALIVWNASDFLRSRIYNAVWELQTYSSDNQATSSGQRLEFWRKSAEFVAAAPLVGHGTGSLNKLFKESAAGKTGATGTATTNPHNQFFAVAIQLGLVGAAILGALWAAHLMLFRRPGLIAWIGQVMVVQNFIASIFNAHLFDFTEGWIYVCAVGVLGGMRGQGLNLPPMMWAELKCALLTPKRHDQRAIDPSG